MKFQKGNKIGPRFDSENQPPKQGRRKSLKHRLEEIIGRELDAPPSASDINSLISTIIGMSKEELKEFVKSDTAPVWLVGIAAGAMGDIKSMDYKNFERFIDRLIGKSAQPVVGNVDLKTVQENMGKFIDTMRERTRILALRADNTEETDTDTD